MMDPSLVPDLVLMTAQWLVEEFVEERVLVKVRYLDS